MRHAVVPVLLALTLVAFLPAAAPAAQHRLVVGFEALPPGLHKGSAFHGQRVVSVDPVLGTAVMVGPGLDMSADPAIRYVEEDVAVRMSDLVPNDPLFGSQSAPAVVRAPAAWAVSLGAANAAVCVVDTGVRYSHDDLAGARWRGGYDFVNSDNDPMDDNGHGTHVAAIAVAGTDNGVGIAGMAQADLYAAKVLDLHGSGSVSAVASGIAWCADHTPVRTVINLSLGTLAYSQSLADAVDYAYTTKGKLVVAAAGNDGGMAACATHDCISYPAKLANAIAVTCITSGSAACTFSSAGPEAEIAAPGNQILSAYATSDSAYATLSGTSMSTPVVSGAAALLWSHEPTLTNAQVRDRLQASAVDLGAPGRDAVFGDGRLDAYCLLVCAPAADVSLVASVPNATLLFGAPTALDLQASNAGPDDAYGVRVTATVPRGLRIDLTTLPAGCTATSLLVTCRVGVLGNGATATFAIPASGTIAGAKSIVAIVLLDSTDPDLSNNAVTIPLTVLRRGADLQATLATSAATTFAGATVDYTLAVANGGSLPATAAVATFRLPRQAGDLVLPAPCTAAGLVVTCAAGNLAVGGSWQATVTATGVRAGVGAATLQVSANEPDPGRADNRATATVRVVAPAADLSSSVSGNPTALAVGSTVHFNLTVANAGPQAAPFVVATLRLPFGMAFDATTLPGGCSTAGLVATCQVGTLANGGSVSYPIDATATRHVRQSAMAGVSGIVADAALGNNRAAVFVTAV